MTGVAPLVISEETYKVSAQDISAETHFEPAEEGTRIDMARVTSFGV